MSSRYLDEQQSITFKTARALELVAALTDVERQYLRNLVDGCSQSEVAGRLGLDPTSASQLRQALLEKLGARCTADAVREGILAGF